MFLKIQHLTKNVKFLPIYIVFNIFVKVPMKQNFLLHYVKELLKL